MKLKKFLLSKKINTSDLKRLPFMTRCIMETLRLHTANGTLRELIDDEMKMNECIIFHSDECVNMEQRFISIICIIMSV